MKVVKDGIKDFKNVITRQAREDSFPAIVSTTDYSFYFPVFSEALGLGQS